MLPTLGHAAVAIACRDDDRQVHSRSISQRFHLAAVISHVDRSAVIHGHSFGKTVQGVRERPRAVGPVKRQLPVVRVGYDQKLAGNGDRTRTEE